MGARMDTCSFKELEAPPTIVRAGEHGGRAMVLASVGNTARAFAYISTITGFPVVIVVPRKSAHNLWIPGREPGDSVRLITMAEGNDYSDAIRLSERISGLPGMLPEGGARNVARRDGMGVTLAGRGRNHEKDARRLFPGHRERHRRQSPPGRPRYD